MIEIIINPEDISNFNVIVQNKVKSAEFMAHYKSMTEVAKAMFTITTKKFLQDLSVAAQNDHKRYHHLYEWEAIGRTSRKLFAMERTRVIGGELIITIVPIKSTKAVPIRSPLNIPGPTGKVVTAKHIFRDKMQVIENNDPVTIETKRTIVFSPDGQKLIFVPKDKVITIKNPGGTAAKDALLEFSNTWYSTKPEMVMDQSRLIRQMANRVVDLLNTDAANPESVYRTIQEVNKSYSKEITVR
jgi:hypothetical protein